MRHGYLRPDEAAVTAAENALRAKSTDEIAEIVEGETTLFDKVMGEAGVNIDFSNDTSLGGATNDDKADKLSESIARRAAGGNIIAERQEAEAAKNENEAANERLREYRRGPRLFTPEQVREIASQNTSGANAAPASMALAEQVRNHFGDGRDFSNRFGSPFGFETTVPVSSLVMEPQNVIAEADTMRPGTGGTETQTGIGVLRFPPLQPDYEYFARRQTSVFNYLASRVSRNIPNNYGGAYRYSAEVAPSGTAPAFRRAATALSQREFGTEIRTVNLEFCGEWVPVSREEFLDVQGFTMFLNTVIRDDVMLAIDDQLLNGDGTAPNILGLNSITGKQTVNLNATSVGSGKFGFGTTAIHEAKTLAFATGHTNSDFVVMNPNDWHLIRTQRDTEDRLLIGGELMDVMPSLFGMPVISTPAQAAETVFVGASMKLMLLQQGGLMVEWTNAHDDGFGKLIDAVRAYCRIGLVSRRDAGQAEVVNFIDKRTGA